MSEQVIKKDSYDPNMIPAETAARIEREGSAYKQVPESGADEGLDTTAGYTVDGEGLVNNYAVEPEIYYEVPGDRTAMLEAEAAEQAHAADEAERAL